MEKQTPVAKQAGDLKLSKNPPKPADTSSIGHMSRSSYVAGRDNLEEFFTPEQCASIENFTAETIGLMDHNSALASLPQGVEFLSGEGSEEKEGEPAKEFGGGADMNNQLFQQEEPAPTQSWGYLTSSGRNEDDYEWNTLPDLYNRLRRHADHGGATVHDDFSGFNEVLTADKDLSEISPAIGMSEGYEMGLPLDNTSGGQLASLSAWTLPQSGPIRVVEYTGDEYLSGVVGDTPGFPLMSSSAFSSAFSSAAHANTQNFIPNMRLEKRQLESLADPDNQSGFKYVDGPAPKRYRAWGPAEEGPAQNTQEHKFNNQQAQSVYGGQQVMGTHRVQPQGTPKGKEILKFTSTMKGQPAAGNMDTSLSSQVLTEKTAAVKAQTIQIRKGGRSVPPDHTDPRWNIWVVGSMEINHKADGIAKKHLRAALARDDKQLSSTRSKWTFQELVDEVIARREVQMKSGNIMGRPDGWLEHLAWWSYF